MVRQDRRLGRASCSDGLDCLLTGSQLGSLERHHKVERVCGLGALARRAS
jgi:hypothetical protein